MTDGIPQHLGKYEVKKEISRGSMGIVFLGHDPYIDRPVAIKVALAESLNDPESGDRYRKMFFNEAHTAGKLTHPNIISIYDAGVDNDICYIIMECISGGDTLKTSDLKMFFNEAHTAGKLTHPNIISIYDAGVDNDICYIIMECISGGDTLKTYTRPD